MDKLRKLQLVELDILKEFIRICDENNLTYYALAGTALGAVRHKGFIPWDDDIDVSMPRKDYDKFHEIVSKNQVTHYVLETVFTNKNHDFPAMKLTDTSVTMIGKKKTKIQRSWNAFIDIFPLDGLPDNNLKRFFHVRYFLFKRDLFYVSNFELAADFGDKKLSLKKKIAMSFIDTFKLHRLFNKVNRTVSGDKTLRKYKFYETKFCSPQLWGQYRTKAVFPTEWLGKGVSVPFEDTQIVLPEKYDKYLTQLFGESYMEMPPVEKRVAHCSDIIFHN